MNKKNLTEAQMQELLLRMKKNYTYDAATGRLTSSRLGRAIRGKKRDRCEMEINFRQVYMVNRFISTTLTRRSTI